MINVNAKRVSLLDRQQAYSFILFYYAARTNSNQPKYDG